MRPLVVMGTAPCLYADLDALGRIDADFMAINRAGLDPELPVQFWATLHHRDFTDQGWLEHRKYFGGSIDFTAIFRVRIPDFPAPVMTHRAPDLSGSSALYGVSAGLSLGYGQIVVVGAPLKDDGYISFRPGWLALRDKLIGRVTSMSGWTREFLGAPDGH